MNLPNVQHQEVQQDKVDIQNNEVEAKPILVNNNNKKPQATKLLFHNDALAQENILKHHNSYKNNGNDSVSYRDNYFYFTVM